MPWIEQYLIRDQEKYGNQQFIIGARKNSGNQQFAISG
jgi:hypothetical protein